MLYAPFADRGRPDAFLAGHQAGGGFGKQAFLYSRRYECASRFGVYPATAERFCDPDGYEDADFPADRPDETIDYIAVYAKDTTAFTRISSRVWDEPAVSDHRPIITDIIFNQPVGKIFRTEPYLQNPVGNGITVMWQTTVPTYSWVEYGTDKEHLQKARTIVDGR